MSTWFYWPCTSLLSIQILTKDSVTAKVDAVVYFRIADPIAAILKAENAKDSTYRISQSTLRDVLGTRTLAEILAERDVISEQLGVSGGVCLNYSARACCHTYPAFVDTCM